ncbi:acyl carrier protein [Antrihabitans spumae]|jgi:acyl carrier protein|uniref:Acyl carrier protein n=1 Tax=Antrihabitans spumae TaxID=3373370 RepID=A0ABW7K6Y2_9NOCA
MMDTDMRTIEPIVDWLVERVAFYVELPAQEIDPDVPLAELGIESVVAVSLCGEIEDRWELDLDPTVVFDYPTIADMASFIAEEDAAQHQKV